MTYGFEAFGFSTAPFTDGPLVHATETESLKDLRNMVFNAFALRNVAYVMITNSDERRMVATCAQFDADYMKDVPQNAGD